MKGLSIRLAENEEEALNMLFEVCFDCECATCDGYYVVS